MLSVEQSHETTVIARDGVLDRLLTRGRRRIFAAFIDQVRPSAEATILDVGASAQPAAAASNFIEQWHAHPQRIVACGLEPPHPGWSAMFPGVGYEVGNALALPFPDRRFDIVFSNAVLEHVGDRAAQTKMISEALRVARTDVFLTTPNPAHPVEFHTVLPLLHWLPADRHRSILRALGRGHFADPRVLNLMSRRVLEACARAALAGETRPCELSITSTRFFGFPANLLLHIRLHPHPQALTPPAG